MTELRELLEVGAGAPPGPPDLAAVRARGRARVRRRRMLVGAPVAAALAVSVAALPRLLSDPAGQGVSVLTPAESGVLRSGRYTNDRLVPKITFAVPDSDTTWRVALASRSSLVLADDEDGIRISVLRWTAVRGAPSASTPSAGAPEALPADLPGWLADNPAVRLSGPVERVRLLGRPARRVTFDVRGDRLPAVPTDCCAGRLTLADTPDNPFAVSTEETAQVTTVDGDRSGLVVAVVFPTIGTDAEALAEAEGIVDSIAPTG